MDDDNKDKIPVHSDSHDEPSEPIEPPTVNEPPLSTGSVNDDTTTPMPIPKSGRRPWHWIKTHKRITALIILGILVVAGVGVWFTDARFAVLNLFGKASIELTVTDEKTNQPIPGVKASLGSQAATTGKDGKATLGQIPYGNDQVKLEKQAYATKDVTIRVDQAKTSNQQALQPVGTPLQFSVADTIGGAAIAGAKVTFGDSDAISDDKGVVVLHVPPQTVDQIEVTVTADGYNSLKLKVSLDQTVKNVAAMTPSGKLYFLSKRTGKISVMKSDLDGTNQSVVLAGTGKESDTNTILLSTRDWKYQALLSTREGVEKLYLINTSNDQLTTMDEGTNVNFALAGWHDHDFVYTVNRQLQPWQPKAAALKSYNADTKALRTLDETTAQGSAGSYGRQLFSTPYIFDKNIVYLKNWDSYGFPAVAGKSELDSIAADGSQKKVIKQFDDDASIALRSYEAKSLYVARYTQPTTTYYEYENDALKQITLTDADFSKFYPTYLASPSGNKTFWYEPRDGKNTLFIGDGGGGNGKNIGDLTDYVAYGWYSDKYILLSKNKSELYVAAAAPVGNANKALKITDYHKPAFNFEGYGYGYGGF